MVGKTVALRKQLLGAIASGLFLAGGMMATPSIAADAAPAAVTQKVEGHNELWSKLTAEPGAKLPVIVQFSMPALPDAATFASAKAADDAQTKAIHAAQDKILGAVLPSGTLSSSQATEERNLKRMDFSPMFGMLADADDLAKLAANPNVTVIQEDVAVPPSLIQSLPIIQMPAMYSAGATGNGYHVAVLDTGGRRSHQFLSSRIVSEACYNSTFAQHGSTSRCPGGATSSTATGSGEDCTASNIYGCGHGTHVAGTAAGFNTAPQSGQPSNGVARDARIISINIFSQFPASQCGSLPSGYNSCVLTYTSDQISGLERVYALRNTYNIAAVNMSLGGGQYSSNCDSDSRKPIIDQLKAARIATVIAAGNEYLPDEVGAPGCISSAVTVGSATKSDVKSDFSNWGPLIDVVAPGSSILASYINGSSNSQFSSLSGTSMASPHVTGAFAAIRTAHPNATVDQIETALKSTGTGISAHGVTKPRINVNSARLALGGTTPPPTGPANDDFADSQGFQLPVNGSVQSFTGTNVDATSESGEPMHAGVSTARNSVWWHIRPMASGVVTVSTVGSTFDTVLAVYTGSQVNALTAVASNDDAGSSLQSRVTFEVSEGQLYRVAVAGYNNAAGNITLSARLTVPRPANDNFANSRGFQVPADGSVQSFTGTNVGATSESGEPMHAGVSTARNSVWWHIRPMASGVVTVSTVGSNVDTVLAVYAGSAVNGLAHVASNNNINGSVPQSRVTFNGIAGNLYRIAVAGVGNAAGNITLSARLTVPRPANDNFANSRGFQVPADGSVQSFTGTNAGATSESGEPNHAGISTARNSVWWHIRPMASGVVTVSTVGSNVDTVLAVYAGSAVNGLAHVASNNNINGSVPQSRVTFNGIAGNLYRIAVAGVGNAAGNITLSARLTVPGGGFIANASSVRVEPVDVPTSGAAISAASVANTAQSIQTTPAVANQSAAPTGGVDVQRSSGVKSVVVGTGKSNGQMPTASAAAVAPVDLVSTVVTPSNDGVLRVPRGGHSSAVVAVHNAGPAVAMLTAQLSLSPVDASVELANKLSICRTDASTGACIDSTGSFVAFTAEPGEVVTFAAFVGHQGEPVKLDPADNRLYVHFRQHGRTVATASLPFCTAEPDGCANDDRSINAAQLQDAL